MPQEIADHDLILASRSGTLFLIKMSATKDAAHHEPISIEPLDQALERSPKFLSDAGVTLARIPTGSLPGRASCYFVSLQGLARPAADRPEREPAGRDR
jgi:hypothetical protein